MIGVSSLVQITADIAMIIGGSYIFLQNYRYWSKYGGSPSVYWSVLGASGVLLGCWVIITRFLLPTFVTLDAHVTDLLSLSRRIMYAGVFLYFVGLGFWEYVWNK